MTVGGRHHFDLARSRYGTALPRHKHTFLSIGMGTLEDRPLCPLETSIPAQITKSH